MFLFPLVEYPLFMRRVLSITNGLIPHLPSFSLSISRYHWYSSRAQMVEEAKLNYKPALVSRIPADFSTDIPAGSLMIPMSNSLNQNAEVV